MGRRWSMAELRDLVAGTSISGRDLQTNRVPVPETLTELGEVDERPWREQVAAGHRGGYSTVVRAWWDAVNAPGELVEATTKAQVDGRWHEVRIGNLNLVDHADVGCVVTFHQIGDPCDPPPADESAASYDAPAAIVQHLDELGFVLHTEGDLEHVFGRSAEELKGLPVSDLLHPDDLDASVAMWLEILDAPDTALNTQQRILQPDGSTVWVQSMVLNRLASSGVVLTVSYDVTASREQRAALAASERELRFLTDAVPVAVFRTGPDGEITFSNSQWSDLLDGAVSFEQALSRLHAQDSTKLIGAHDNARLSGARVVTRVRAEDGRHLEFRLQGIVEPGPQHPTGVIGTVDDVTDDVARARQLEATAERDHLTGLANRRGLRRALEAAVAGDDGSVVLFGDLDEFKRVNDQWGHALGDQVLARIGERLRGAVRPTDVVGRWGGDEFLIVCRSVPAGEDHDVLARVEEALATPMTIDDLSYTAGASFGVVRPHADESVESLLARADTAMYETKRSRRCT